VHSPLLHRTGGHRGKTGKREIALSKVLFILLVAVMLATILVAS